MGRFCYPFLVRSEPNIIQLFRKLQLAKVDGKIEGAKVTKLSHTKYKKVWEKKQMRLFCLLW